MWGPSGVRPHRTDAMAELGAWASGRWSAVAQVSRLGLAPMGRDDKGGGVSAGDWVKCDGGAAGCRWELVRNPRLKPGA